MAENVVELLAFWMGRFKRHRIGMIWRVVHLCHIWFLWRERNARAFQDTKNIFAGFEVDF